MFQRRGEEEKPSDVCSQPSDADALVFKAGVLPARDERRTGSNADKRDDEEDR